MKRLLCLLMMVGIIFTSAMPMGAFAADEIIGYEFNGTTDGWAFTDGTAAPTGDALTETGFNLNSYKEKFFAYENVTNWGNEYTLSFDVTMNTYNCTSMASIFFDCIGAANSANSNRLNIKSGNASTEPIIKLQERTSSGSTTLKDDSGAECAADLTVFNETPTAIFGSSNNKWHIEIKRSGDNIAVYAKPNVDSYTGEMVKVIDYSGTAGNRTGKVALWVKTDRSNNTFDNIKITKNTDTTASYDYNWNGNVNDWTLDDNQFIVTDGTLKAQNIPSNGSDPGMAFYDAVKWSGNQTIKCYMKSLCYNSASSSILFNAKDGQNHYKLEVVGRQTACLRRIVNGSTAEVLGTYTHPDDNAFYHGDWEINYSADGKINVWFTPTNGEKTQIFEDITDTTYTSGKIGFIAKTDGETYFKNISVSGNFISNSGNGVCRSEITGVKKHTNGTFSELSVSGLDYAVSADAAVSGMNMTVPVRYAVESGTRNVWVVVAYFGENNKFIKADKIDVTVSADEGWKKVPVEVTLPEGVQTMSCFVWDTELFPSLTMSHTN